MRIDSNYTVTASGTTIVVTYADTVYGTQSFSSESVAIDSDILANTSYFNVMTTGFSTALDWTKCTSPLEASKSDLIAAIRALITTASTPTPATLQSAYDNGDTIILNSNGAFILRENASNVAGQGSFVIQNTSGAPKFSVDAQSVPPITTLDGILSVLGDINCDTYAASNGTNQVTIGNNTGGVLLNGTAESVNGFKGDILEPRTTNGTLTLQGNGTGDVVMAPVTGRSRIQNVPHGIYTSATDQVVATSSGAVITLSTTVSEQGMSLASNTVTITSAGWYLINATFTYKTSFTATRVLFDLYINGLPLTRDERSVTSGFPACTVIWQGFLSASATVQLFTFQNSGGNQTIGSFVDTKTQLQITYLHET